MYIVFGSKIQAVKSTLKLPSCIKVVFGPPFLEKGIPQISDIHFKIALISKHVVGFG